MNDLDYAEALRADIIKRIGLPAHLVQPPSLTTAQTYREAQMERVREIVDRWNAMLRERSREGEDE